MKKGFTLIEITVVIAIIGILVTMGFGSYMASLKKGRDLKRKSDIVQIGKALEIYFNDTGAYPTSSNGSIKGCGSPPAVCTWGVSSWSNPSTSPATIYMAKLPQDPTTGRSYYYDSDAKGTYYQIYARLENPDDKDLRKFGGYVLFYQGTVCGVGMDFYSTECQYGVSSPNKTPEDGHDLHYN